MIISKINGNDIEWTEMASMDAYKPLVKSAKQFADTEPLADWKLGIWNSRTKT